MLVRPSDQSADEPRRSVNAAVSSMWSANEIGSDDVAGFGVRPFDDLRPRPIRHAGTRVIGRRIVWSL